MAIRLTDDELIELFDVQLPALLDRRPEMEPRIYHAFLKTFARKEEVASVLAELRGFRAETRENFEQVDQRFEQVDQRFEQVDQRFEQVDGRLGSLESRVEDGFREVQRAIDRLGARWGIRNESVFRQTVATLLEQSFGAQVEERHIAGEQFDCIIHDGEHILVEIAASAEKNIQKRLEHKRELYTRETGTAPTRVILVTASIHSQRAQALREAGFEVIEPEEEQADD
ncbi:MAG: DUF3782 domain-containing protein [Thermoflexales bacterium]|nr:DUF3782 domain-containing protein [Thermoflexales bacterium]